MGRIDLEHDYVGASYDLYLGPPPVGVNRPFYTTLQSLMDAAEALGATLSRNITVWVAQSPSPYGDATILIGGDISFEAAGPVLQLGGDFVNTVGQGPLLGNITVGNAANDQVALALGLKNISMGDLIIFPPIGGGYALNQGVSLITENAYIHSVIKGTGGGAGGTTLWDCYCVGTQFGPITIDRISDAKFAACQFDVVQLQELWQTDFDACTPQRFGTVAGQTTLPAWLTILDNFNGVRINVNIENTDTVSNSGAIVCLKCANALGGPSGAPSGMTISGVITQVGDGGAGTWYIVCENGGAAIPNHVVVSGVSAEVSPGAAVMKGAVGAFSNSVFGPNAPDNLDYSGVTGTGNVFYTSGAVPAGVVPVGGTPSLARTLMLMGA